MQLMDSGYTILKFFPAGPAGGIPYLKALAAPLPAISFCPTGGVDATNAGDYLALANVVCVGGSWVTPRDALASRNWPRIEALAREASRLGAKR
jgi:2-dehydro-3-deoxyphosphogluconate aldolase/(4S)-4-hydroxy-2-oxoglutarate aldolase